MDAIGAISPIIGTAAVIGATEAIQKEAKVAGRAGKKRRKSKRIRN